MNTSLAENAGIQIIDRAKDLGASLAGIVNAEELGRSPSYEIKGRDERLLKNRAVLVFALVHERTEPSMDWWDGIKGTPGNSRLIDIGEMLAHELLEEFRLKTQHLPYHVEKGGVFLKDAAVLAGIGVIGKSNLLITPDFGPRIRLRALLIDAPLDSSDSLEFDPCRECEMPCVQACPQMAFAQGAYSRPSCSGQMKKNENKASMVEKKGTRVSFIPIIKYCRACELVCSVGK
jgi:epoxyqueuosine reductase